MPLDDSLIPNKGSRYTPDPLPDAIYIDSGNSVINFTTPYESPKISLLNLDATDTDHIIMRDKHVHATEKILY